MSAPPDIPATGEAPTLTPDLQEVAPVPCAERNASLRVGRFATG